MGAKAPSQRTLKAMRHHLFANSQGKYVRGAAERVYQVYFWVHECCRQRMTEASASASARARVCAQGGGGDWRLLRPCGVRRLTRACAHPCTHAGWAGHAGAYPQHPVGVAAEGAGLV